MTNRVLAERCIGCGDDLLWPYNELMACSKCTPKIAQVIYETKMRKRDKKSKTQVHLNKGIFAVANHRIGTKVEL